MIGQRKLDIFQGQNFCKRCGRRLKKKDENNLGGGCKRVILLKRFGSKNMIKIINSYLLNSLRMGN
jgi:hypothetical protein